MKEYQAIRRKVPFLTLCKDKDLVTEVTVAAQSKLGTDAAIIFSDLLLILEPLGFQLEYSKDEGPVIRNPIGNSRDVDRMNVMRPEQSLEFVFSAIRQTRRALKPDVPLIGFAGAPFTLASYLVEGGKSKSFDRTRHFMRVNKSAWHILMDKITSALVRYLDRQVNAGVQAVQVFDTWVGCLSRREYQEDVFPHSTRLFRELGNRVPVIHFGTNTGHFIDLMRDAGGQIIGIDHRIGLDKAWEKVGFDRGIQGNLNPNILLTSIKNIKKHVRRILAEAKGRSGHIFNLGHGVLPATPVDRAIRLVQLVHELSSRPH